MYMPLQEVEEMSNEKITNIVKIPLGKTSPIYKTDEGYEVPVAGKGSVRIVFVETDTVTFVDIYDQRNGSCTRWRMEEFNQLADCFNEACVNIQSLSFDLPSRRLERYMEKKKK